MFTLFSIVAIAVLLVASQSDQRRRWGLVVIGGLCLVLGLRGGVLLTESSLTHLVSSVAMADDSGTAAVQAEVASTQEVGELSAIKTEEDGIAAPDEPAAGPIERVTAVEYPDSGNYPSWLKRAPNSSGLSLVSTATTDGLHHVVVQSGLYVTDNEGRRDLDDRLKEAVNDYINEYLNSRRAALMLGYSADAIRTQLVRDTFEERVSLGGERLGRDWRKTHALLGFSEPFRRDLDERWGRIIATARLMQTGFGAGIVLLLLGTLFSYFRFDTATRGYYTGRLQFATAAAILAVVAAGVLVAKWIPWM